MYAYKNSNIYESYLLALLAEYEQNNIFYGG